MTIEEWTKILEYASQHGFSPEDGIVSVVMTIEGGVRFVTPVGKNVLALDADKVASILKGN